MVDSASQFTAKNRKQFERAKRALRFVGAEFIKLVNEDLVLTTRGDGLQLPPDTLYIATGRLRGGWNYTREPIWHSSKGIDAKRHEDGPFSDYGEETIERVNAQVDADRIGGISYLENNVGYGDIVRRGAGRHVQPYNWPYTTSRKQHSFARQAIQNLGSFR